MPNLYAPNDNFDLESSHVLPALIRKFHLSKLAARGDLEALQQDESLFGPIPEDLRQSFGLPGDLKNVVAPQAEPVFPGGPLNRREKENDFSASSAPQATEGSGCESKNVLNPPDAHAVVVWGTGNARREFLHVDDLADASVLLMNRYEDPEHINVGVGSDLTIKELAETVKDTVFPEAKLVFDQTKPDGTPQKLLDLSRLTYLGWQPKITFSTGIKETYTWYLSQNL